MWTGTWSLKYGNRSGHTLKIVFECGHSNGRQKLKSCLRSYGSFCRADRGVSIFFFGRRARLFRGKGKGEGGGQGEGERERGGGHHDMIGIGVCLLLCRVHAYMCDV